jgi:hypothetical protein
LLLGYLTYWLGYFAYLVIWLSTSMELENDYFYTNTIYKLALVLLCLLHLAQANF